MVQTSVVSKEAVSFRFDDLVTLAAQFFQPGPIKNLNLAAAVTDDAEFLQLSGRFGDAFAPDSQHIGNQFLCHYQMIAAQAVERQQKPAAKLLINAVVPVTDCGLCHLGDPRLGNFK